jgi:hypothetical protein
VAERGEFQEQVSRLSELLVQYEQTPAGLQKDAGKQLIQLLMDVHGHGLERIVEIIFESGESGSDLIDRLAKDEAAGGLLLLYSLHPDALDARVHNALERLRPRLRKLSCAIDLLSIDEGAVRVAITKGGHACGSSSKEVRAMIESGVYELAPDVTTLEILGLEEPVASGFVALDSLLAGVSAGNGAK